MISKGCEEDHRTEPPQDAKVFCKGIKRCTNRNCSVIVLVATTILGTRPHRVAKSRTGSSNSATDGSRGRSATEGDTFLVVALARRLLLAFDSL